MKWLKKNVDFVVFVVLFAILVTGVVAMRWQYVKDHQRLKQLSNYHGYACCMVDVQAALDQDGTNGVARLFERKMGEMREFCVKNLRACDVQ